MNTYQFNAEPSPPLPVYGGRSSDEIEIRALKLDVAYARKDNRELRTRIYRLARRCDWLTAWACFATAAALVLTAVTVL